MKIKNLLKRIGAFGLSIAIFMNTDLGGFTFAGTPAATGEIYTVVDGVNISLKSSDSVSLEYGQLQGLELYGYASASFYVQAATGANFITGWNDYAGENLTAGETYYLAAIENSAYNEYGFSGEYSVTVTQATYMVPENLSWSGQTATWNAMQTSTTGHTLPAPAYYTVTLYKDGVAVPGQSKMTTLPSYDFSSAIAGGGFGDYTFTVMAIAPTGQEDNYASSAVSSASGAFTYEDTVAPVISAVSYASGQLTGTVSDAETGVAAYAWSTETDSTKISAWTSVDPMDAVVGATVNIATDPVQAGALHLHVKDNNGNTAVSSQTVTVTEITLNGYYNGGSSAVGKSFFLIEDATLTAGELTALAPARTGYGFAGWYRESTYENVLTTVVPAAEQKGTVITIYAKWTEQSLDFSANPASVNRTYDGTETELIAELPGSVTGTITWNWYYKADSLAAPVDLGAGDSSGHRASIKVKNVSDSGYYYAKATVSVVGMPDRSTTSDEAQVTIMPRILSVKGAAADISFGDDAPDTFSFVLTESDNSGAGKGLADGDSLADVVASHTGDLTCGYTKWDAAGAYTITLNGAQTFLEGNYTVVFSDSENGCLTVQPKDVENCGGEVVAALTNPGEVLPYTGSNVTPAVSVTDTATGAPVLVPGADYTVSYENNISAGVNTAIARIAFAGNYTGEMVVRFTISRKSYTATVSISDWIYGDTPSIPALSTYPGVGTVTYYYQPVSAGAFSFETAVTSVPTDAGEYYIAAIIGASANYEEYRTAAATFRIKKRPITITSYGGTWDYDGNPHTTEHVPAVEITSGNFAGEDSMLSMSAAVSVKNIGTVKNTITYTLTRSTNPDNYEITLVEGDLIINQSELPQPAGFGWSNSLPGTLNWVGISRSGVVIKYVVKLYRVEFDGTVSTEPIATKEVVGANSVDFAEEIHSDSETNGCAGYAATMQVIPVYAAGDVQNYRMNSPTAWNAIPTRYTAKLTVAENTGVEAGSPRIDGGTSAILLQGESAHLVFAFENGFGYADPAPSWTIGTEGLGKLSLGSAYLRGTTVTYLTTAASPITGTVILTPHSKDSSPSYTYCNFSNNPSDGYHDIRVEAGVRDILGLSAWGVKKDDGAIVWTEIGSGDQHLNSYGTAYEYDFSYNISEAGVYVFYVKDTFGNISTSGDGVVVYRIAFDGNGNDGGTAMAPMFKLENTVIPIPDITYTLTGNVLRYWQGATGVYAKSGASYAANKSDTLVAQWTDESYSYTVEYYYQNLDGTYDTTPETSVVFHAGYDEVITAKTSAIQKSRTGFAVDVELTAGAVTGGYYFTQVIPYSIQIRDNSSVLKVYYKRNEHTITYRYTDKNGLPVEDSDTYKFGAPVVVRDTPTEVGYDFIGWNFGTDGVSPAAMPDQNLVFTGYFEAVESVYYVTNYFQNLDGDNWGGVLDNYSLGETTSVYAHHGDALAAGFRTSANWIGYRIAAVVITYGAPGGTEIPEGANTNPMTDVNGTVDAPGTTTATYINYYYTRNIYNITLNVYKDDRDTGTLLYTENNFGLQPSGAISVAFGTPITAEQRTLFSTYGYDANRSDNKWLESWIAEAGGLVASEIDGYMLASYTDWSTDVEPTTMPDGDVVITRDYVSATNCQYRVEVYMEGTVTQKDANGYSYTDAAYPVTPSATFFYYGPLGSEVTLGNNGTYTVDYTTFGDATEAGAISYFNYYTYDAIKNATSDAKTSGIITDGTNEPELVLKVYFARKETEAIITYYYNDGTMPERAVLGTRTVTGKWGTSYDFHTLMGYDGDFTGFDTVTAAGTAMSGTSFRNNVYQVSYYSLWYAIGYSSNSPAARFDYESPAAATAAGAAASSGLQDTVYGTFSRPTGADGNTTTLKSYGYVTYSKLLPEERFYVNIMKRPYGGRSGDEVFLTARLEDYTDTDGQPVTVTLQDGSAFSKAPGAVLKLRAADKASLFDASYSAPGTMSTIYPAGDIYRAVVSGAGVWSYGSLKAGFEPITYEKTLTDGTTVSATYYTDGEYIYITQDSNQFFSGNRVSFNVNSVSDTDKVFLGIREQVIDYAANNSYGIYWNGVALEPHYGTTPISQIITFYYDPVYYTVRFNYNGSTCPGHSFLSGTVKTGTELAELCNTFASEPGYHITWYVDDGTFSHKVEDLASVTITSSRTYVGRREKDGIRCDEYAFYKVLNPVSAGLTTVRDYFTKAVIDSISWTVYADRDALMAAVADGSETGFAYYTETLRDQEFTFDMGSYTTTIKEDVQRISYYYGNTLVAIKQDHYYPSFSEISMTTGDYEAVNGIRGFMVDDTNIGNKLKAYVTTTGVSLMAYYERVLSNLTRVDDPDAANANEVTAPYRYGNTVVLDDPSKEGYNFAGWKYFKNDSTEVAGADLSEVYDAGTHRTSLLMPAHDLRAEAQWDPAPFAYTIVSYFQNTKRAYETTLVETLDIATGTLSAALTTDTIMVSVMGSAAVPGTAIYADAGKTVLLAVSVQNGKDTMYYKGTGITIAGGSTEVTADMLFAATHSIPMSDSETMTSEDICTVGDYVTDVSAYHIFQWKQAAYQYASNIYTFTDVSDTFEAYAAMNLSYYFTRSSNNEIRTLILATDGGSVDGISAIGAGEYVYGDDVTLTVTLPRGYTLVGWFKAADVLEKVEDGTSTAYPDDGTVPTVLTGYGLLDDISGATPMNAGAASFTYTVKSSMDFVAVVKPEGVVIPGLNITSARDLTTDPYVYHYAADGKNSLSAALVWSAGDHSAMAVDGYQWYVKYYEPGETVPSGAAMDALELSEFTQITEHGNSSVYLLGTGKDAGTYLYRCVTDVRNMNNNRHGKAVDTFAVEVLQYENYIFGYDRTYVYDGNEREPDIYIGASYHSQLREGDNVDIYYIEDEDLKTYANAHTSDFYAELTPFDFDTYIATAENLNTLLAAAYAAGIMDDEKPSYKNVRNEAQDPYYVYAYAVSANKNYANTSCSAYVQITPVKFTVTVNGTFSKIYDGTDEVRGADKIGNPAEWVTTDLYNLLYGDYYTINGLLSCDDGMDLRLGCDAHFNDAHVAGAAALFLTNLHIVELTGIGMVENFNYVFDSVHCEYPRLSAEILPYPLAVEWDSSTLTFPYDGSAHAPSVNITDTDAPDMWKIVAGEPVRTDFDVTVLGEQSAAGTHTATATILSSADYNSSDYTFSITTQQYTITPLFLMVKPKDTVRYYNGTVITMEKDDANNICDFELYASPDGTPGSYVPFTLPDGQRFITTPLGSGKDAGTYTVRIKPGTTKIYNGATNVSDNYAIEENGTGTLTILPCPVIVTGGITASDKPYDGNTGATLNLSGATFSHLVESRGSATTYAMTAGLYGSDALSLVTGNVIGTFVSPDVANDVTVNLHYDMTGAGANGTGGALGGVSVANYRLIDENGEDFGTGVNEVNFYSQKVTDADITAQGIYIRLRDTVSYYGEIPVYEYEFVDALGNVVDTSDVSPLGTLQIRVAKWIENTTPGGDKVYDLTNVLANTGNTSAIQTIDAGSYRIFPVVDGDGVVQGITSSNYNIYYAYKGPGQKTSTADDANEPAKLTIKPRKVQVQAVAGSNMEKVFDATTAAGSIAGLYEFVAVSGDTHSGLVNGDTLTLTTHQEAYNDEDVADATCVNVTGCSITSVNYELANTAFDIDGAITPLPVTITVADKEIEYGDAAPEHYAFTYTYAGTLGQDAKDYLDSVCALLEAAPSSVLAFDCDYVQLAGDPNSNAGNYTVAVDSLTRYSTPNLTITYASGTLKVDKREVLVTAFDTSMVYGKVSDMATVLATVTWDYQDSDFVYGEDENSVLTPAQLGSISAAFETEQGGAVTITSPAGSYVIKLNGVTSLVTDNYTFVVKEGTLTINKYYIAFNGIEVNGKEYDGTIAVAPDDIIYDNVVITYFECGEEKTEDRTAVLENGEKVLSNVTVTGTYDTPYAGANKTVYLSFTLSDYLAARYELLTDANKAQAMADTGLDSSITVTQKKAVGFVTMDKRPLKLKPTDITIKYAEAASVIISGTPSAGQSLVVPFGGTDLKTLVIDNGDGTSTEIPDTLTGIGLNLHYTIRRDVTDADTEYCCNSATNTYSDTGDYIITLHNSAPAYLTSGAVNSFLRETDPTFDPTLLPGNTNFNQNYLVIGWGTATLHVVPNRLATPATGWSTVSPGTATFGTVSGIGAVDVDHYELTLYKDGAQVGSMYSTESGAQASLFTLTGSTYSIDLADVIRANGAGTYTYKVKAVASTTNNAGNINVLDSLLSAGTEELLAAQVTFRFDPGAETTGAAAATKTVGGVSEATATGLTMINPYDAVSGTGTGVSSVSMILIDGETNPFSLQADWENADGYRTGYEVESVLSSADTVFAVTNGKTGYPVANTSRNGTYYGSLTQVDDLTPELVASGITITLKLKKRAATVTGSMGIVNNHVTYLYAPEAAPIVTVTPAVGTGDNITTAEYDYSYAWQYKKTRMGALQNVMTGTPATDLNDQVWNVPEGLGAATYYVYVVITATRKDNGASVTMLTPISGDFVVDKASPQPNWIAVVMPDWTYGDVRGVATPVKGSAGPGVASLGTITLEYAAAGSSVWTTVEPVNAGTYRVRANVEANSDFNGFISNETIYTISQNQLAVPSNLSMGPSATAPYGRVSWDAVTGPKENNGGTGSASEIDVKYELTLRLTPLDGGADVDLCTVTTTATEYDFTQYIHDAGNYTVVAQALVANEDVPGHRDAQALKNCADSDITSIHTVISIGTKVSVTGSGVTVSGNSAAKVYDGQPMTLSVSYTVGPDTTYQWMKDGVDIPGATSATLVLTYVEDTAVYSCRILPNGPATPLSDYVYSSVMNGTINPRIIVVYAASDEKTYDGSPLTRDNVVTAPYDWSVPVKTDVAADAAGYSLGIASGDTLTTTLTGAVTEVGTASNVLGAVTIRKDTDGDGTPDRVVYTEGGANNNYIVTKVSGLLKVNKKSLGSGSSYGTGITIDPIADEVYNTAAHTPLVTVRDVNRPSADRVLVLDADYEIVSYSANINVGTVTVTVKGIGNYSGTVTTTFNIIPAPLTSVVLGTSSFEYTHGTTAIPGYSVYAQPAGSDLLLTENTDYTITVDTTAHKQKSAVLVGTYTIEAIGTGNYQGTVYATYVIADSADPVVTGIVNGNVYCGDTTLAVADSSLAQVLITREVGTATKTLPTVKPGVSYGASEIFLQEDFDLTGTYTTRWNGTLPGSIDGTRYTIVVTDASGNTNSTMVVLVYSDHDFDWDGDGEADFTDRGLGDGSEKKVCWHCDTERHRRKQLVTVNFDYTFTTVTSDIDPVTGEYITIDSTLLGDNRAVGAVVELMQLNSVGNTVLFDRKFVSAGDTTSRLVPGRTVLFENLPETDDAGNAYTYSIVVYAADSLADNATTKSAVYYAEHDSTYEATIKTLSSDTFMLEWTINVKAPATANGSVVEPEALYVRVYYDNYLYGQPGFTGIYDYVGNVITQHSAGNGALTGLVSSDVLGAVYTGGFPVWKKNQLGEYSSYKIRVTGFRLNGVDYFLTQDDTRFLSGTYYNGNLNIGEGAVYAAGAVHTDMNNTHIYMDITGLELPVLLFDYNMGADTVNAVTPGSIDRITKPSMTDSVSESEIHNADVTRNPYYEFLGWFTEADGGVQVTSLEHICDLNVLYAHYRELVEPTGTITLGEQTSSTFIDVMSEEPLETFTTLPVLKITAEDLGRGTGVNNSGVDKIYYVVTNGPKTFTEIQDSGIVWTPYNGPAGLYQPGTHMVYVKIVDKAGNEEYISVDSYRYNPPAPIPEPEPEPEDPVVPVPPTVPSTPKPEKPGTGEKPTEPEVPDGPEVPDKPGVPDEPTEPGTGGSLQVEVVNPGDNRPEKPGTGEQEHYAGDLPNREQVADTVLTDEEKEVLKEGGDIIIRLTVDDTKTGTPDAALTDTMNDLLNRIISEKENAGEEVNPDDYRVEFRTYIHLTLEKKINDDPWNRLPATEEAIEVVITIPEGIRKDGETLYLVKADGQGGYIILEDLDDNPDTITILTSDFDSEYAIIAILDEAAALAGLHLPGEKPGHCCWWHILIFILDLIWIVLILIFMLRKRKKDEEEEDEDETGTDDNVTATDSERQQSEEEKEKEKEEAEKKEKKLRRRSTIGRWLAQVLLAILFVIINILGFCHIELPASIISIVVVSLLQYLAYRFKFRKKKDEKEDEKDEDEKKRNDREEQQNGGNMN